MPLIIISTCGTSLLTNGVPDELRSLLHRTANQQAEEMKPEEKALIDTHLQARAHELAACPSMDAVRTASAELNGLLGLYDGQPAKGRGDIHFLLHTDTYQGENSAEILCRWCENHDLSAQTYRVESLNTRNIDEFRIGIGNLMHWCQETLPGYRKNKYRVVFNLVGGFKSLQGYMQTLGMLFADESVYVFEGERALLRIPRLPLDLDAASRECMRKNHSIIRTMLWRNLPTSECTSLPETFLYCVEDECMLSEWGRLLWEGFKKEFYKETLLPPPSRKIRYGRTIEKAVAALDPPSIADINEKMDDLSLMLECNKPIKSLGFKMLTGKPVPGCTHEFYLWSDRDAARGFGYYDGGVFVFDEMRPHL